MTTFSPILFGFVGVLFVLKVALLATAALLIVRSLWDRFGTDRQVLKPVPVLHRRTRQQ